MDRKYSILVNSTDSYEDCWVPFFKLFKKFWPNPTVNIHLNTENKSFSYPGLNIKTTQIGQKKNGDPFSWSESLLLALEKIETPLVLFILDDLFLNKKVDTDKINYLAELMLDNNHSTIYLTDQSTSGPFEQKGSLLWKLDQKATYRISALIALWNKDRLKYYLRKHENPWQFEIYGTKRAHYIKDSFYTLNQDINNNPIISHCYPTGITRGKWNKEAVVNLFGENGIEINFNKRGFFKQSRRTIIKKILLRLNFKNQLYKLKSIIEIQKLKLKNIISN